MMPRDRPHPIDAHVGKRMRMRRVMLGMSQSNLGDALGLTFQQVQRYENGKNRLGASRLQRVAQILQVPVEFLFEGSPQERRPNHAQSSVVSPQFVSDYLAMSEGLQLTRAFVKIPDKGIRRSIVKLVEQIAENQ
jgi:transcriptional regulator with XRE-family HTH domain